MTYGQYLKKAGLAVSPAGPTRKGQRAKDKSGVALLTYRVPKLTSDGTCSVAGHRLAKEPYDLRPILGIQAGSAEEAAVIKRLEHLQDLLAGVQTVLKADWIGIYQKARSLDGTPVLVKLVYEGKPSRAEFPLTEAFAALSNNSTVGLTGKAVVITDVSAHEGPYYECDGLVQSEICLPIFDKSGEDIVGILDAESFHRGHFDEPKIAQAARLCWELAEYLPLKQR
ncbi:hypothetical protein IRY61_00405 [Candidatus Saccharibacteria bacterium]|nr:hypothetical protein [Candidatus Saccharibacteria bacterium]